ncbi:b120 [miniopterid betaherpesvirus 1]|uniref:B120 n=1 Tax=miniopterid betaherpesvirus 1 TaxID=3070189 RepID=I3VQB0_9BETA|nr:b120 [miniopterid betaherpesvirus 1]AFK83954.1 b120 [miniopterid betaherpesvirus 1]
MYIQDEPSFLEIASPSDDSTFRNVSYTTYGVEHGIKERLVPKSVDKLVVHIVVISGLMFLSVLLGYAIYVLTRKHRDKTSPSSERQDAREK